MVISGPRKPLTMNRPITLHLTDAEYLGRLRTSCCSFAKQKQTKEPSSDTADHLDCKMSSITWNHGTHLLVTQSRKSATSLVSCVSSPTNQRVNSPPPLASICWQYRDAIESTSGPQLLHVVAAVAPCRAGLFVSQRRGKAGEDIRRRVE